MHKTQSARTPSRNGAPSRNGKLAAPVASPPAAGLAHKLSVNIAADTGARLRRLAFEQRLSESSIVDVALRFFFARGENAKLGQILRKNGASLRRAAPKAPI